MCNRDTHPLRQAGPYPGSSASILVGTFSGEGQEENLLSQDGKSKRYSKLGVAIGAGNGGVSGHLRPKGVEVMVPTCPQLV